MEGLFNDEEIRRIFAENDPIHGLSEEELIMLRNILITKKKRLNASMPYMATEELKGELYPDYIVVCEQLKIVEARLGSNK